MYLNRFGGFAFTANDRFIPEAFGFAETFGIRRTTVGSTHAKVRSGAIEAGRSVGVGSIFLFAVRCELTDVVVEVITFFKIDGELWGSFRTQERLLEDSGNVACCKIVVIV